MTVTEKIDVVVWAAKNIANEISEHLLLLLFKFVVMIFIHGVIKSAKIIYKKDGHEHIKACYLVGPIILKLETNNKSIQLYNQNYRAKNIKINS